VEVEDTVAEVEEDTVQVAVGDCLVQTHWTQAGEADNLAQVHQIAVEEVVGTEQAARNKAAAHPQAHQQADSSDHQSWPLPTCCHHHCLAEAQRVPACLASCQRICSRQQRAQQRLHLHRQILSASCAAQRISRHPQSGAQRPHQQ
jgi:hypothetical protein